MLFIIPSITGKNIQGHRNDIQCSKSCTENFTKHCKTREKKTYGNTHTSLYYTSQFSRFTKHSPSCGCACQLHRSLQNHLKHGLFCTQRHLKWLNQVLCKWFFKVNRSVMNVGKSILQVPDTGTSQYWWILEHFWCTSVAGKYDIYVL